MGTKYFLCPSRSRKALESTLKATSVDLEKPTTLQSDRRGAVAPRHVYLHLKYSSPGTLPLRGLAVPILAPTVASCRAVCKVASATTDLYRVEPYPLTQSRYVPRIHSTRAQSQ